MQKKAVGIYSIMCLAQKQWKAMHLEQDAEEQEGPDEGEHWHISNYLATEF